jgi:hypothetical protein
VLDAVGAADAVRRRAQRIVDVSLCHSPLLKPMNADPLNRLPPSFSTEFMRIPPPDVSAGIALVMIVISDCSMSSK